MSGPLIGIMQPTFLPWIGYMAMIDSVETFVFLDSVQFARRSWQQRNRIKTPSGPRMITVPVSTKAQRDQLIFEVQIDETQNFRSKIVNTLKSNYGRAPFFKEYSPLFFKVIEEQKSNLADLNIALIDVAMRCLRIEGKKIIRSKDLPVKGAKTDLLVSICQYLGYKNYLSAPGSKEYIDESTAFQDVGIKVGYHEYAHPIYSQQFGAFESHMAVVDLLFNEGPESLRILRQQENRSMRN